MLVLAGVGYAQDMPCEGPYKNETLVTELDAIDEAFRAFKPDEARRLLSATHRNLICLDERADPLGIARLGRQLALTFFFDQDEDAMRRWSMMSRKLAPELPWYADMGEDHPFRSQFNEFEIADMAGPDATLIPPKNGGVFWNGSFVDQPQAPMEMPALVQLADKGGLWIETWWQDGSAWPERVLGEPGDAPKTPKWLNDAVSDARHAEHAALPLFTTPEAAEVASIPAETAAEPSAYSEEEVVAAEAQDDAGSYRDPFEDARRRAIRRVHYQSTSTNESGDNVTINTEVVTFRRDRSGGKPVTYEIFDYWTRDATDWAHGAALSVDRAEAGYLQDWIDARPPPNTSRMPLVWVSFAAAQAYCESYGLSIPPVAAPPVDAALKWEWRLDGAQATRVNAKGKVQATEPGAVHEDTGFRCQ